MWLYIPSRCVQEGAGLKWDSTSPVPEPSHLSFTLSAKPMRQRSWRRAWTTKPWLRRLSGLTLTPSEAQNAAITFAKQQAAEGWNSCSAEFPASPTPSPDDSLAQKILATYGRPCVASLSRTHRSLRCSLRMSQGCLPLAGLNASSQNWKTWISSVRLACSRRRKLALRIAGSGCSSWRSPMERDHHPHGISEANKHTPQILLSHEVEMWQTPIPPESPQTRKQVGATEREPLLPKQAERWKTPHGMANTDATGKVGGAGGGEFALQANNWPTPAARDHKSGEASQETMDSNARPLNEVACHSSLLAPPTSTPGGESSINTQNSPPLWQPPPGVEQQPTGPKRRLNPLFVEMLMGWPIGFSDCGCSVTAAALNRWRSLSSACVLSYLRRVTGE